MTEDVEVHVLVGNGTTSACGLPRSKIYAAHIEVDKITCLNCRSSQVFKKMAPIRTDFVEQSNEKPKRRAIIKYDLPKSNKRKA